MEDWLSKRVFTKQWQKLQEFLNFLNATEVLEFLQQIRVYATLNQPAALTHQHTETQQDRLPDLDTVPN